MLLVFKRQIQNTMESVVSVLSGPQVHVDLIPDPCDPYAYTSYMFENFSKNTTLNAYTPESHVAIRLEMNDAEKKRAVEYLEGCVERSVPYNYPDLMTCIAPAASWVVSDVPPSEPKTLFCSQAAVLCLKHSVDPESPIGQAVAKVHSRLTTPSALYKWAKALGTEVEVQPDMYMVGYAPPVAEAEPVVPNEDNVEDVQLDKE